MAPLCSDRSPRCSSHPRATWPRPPFRVYHLHFTPTYSSWINQLERWFSLLTEKQLRRGTHKSTRQLEDAIRLYLASNASARPFVWTKTADDMSTAWKSIRSVDAVSIAFSKACVCAAGPAIATGRL